MKLFHIYIVVILLYFAVLSFCERGRHPLVLIGQAILVYGSIGFSNLLKHIKESLILAQKERWQRA